MEEKEFILYKTFYDKYEFETVRDALEKAGIEFWASNRATTVNFKVPGSAYTEIELHVAVTDLEQIEILVDSLLSAHDAD